MSIRQAALVSEQLNQEIGSDPFGYAASVWANALTRTALSSPSVIEPTSRLAASRFNRISQGESR